MKCKGFKEFLNWVLKDRHSINGFKQSIHPVEIETAMANAAQNFELEHEQPTLYSTDVFRLAKIILPFVKNQLDKAKEMMENSPDFFS